MHPTNLRRAFHSVLEATEPRRIRYHDMRHTYSINVLKAGENMPTVSRLLGHSSIQITVDTYSHFLHSKERLMRWRGLGEKNKALKKRPLATKRGDNWKEDQIL